jgi:hypothetical protein
MGPLRPSFVLPAEIRRLFDYTRRTHIVELTALGYRVTVEPAAYPNTQFRNVIRLRKPLSLINFVLLPYTH